MPEPTVNDILEAARKRWPDAKKMSIADYRGLVDARAPEWEVRRGSSYVTFNAWDGDGGWPIGSEQAPTLAALLDKIQEKQT